MNLIILEMFKHLQYQKPENIKLNYGEHQVVLFLIAVIKLGEVIPQEKLHLIKVIYYTFMLENKVVVVKVNHIMVVVPEEILTIIHLMLKQEIPEAELQI